jgi:hypothetical protein
VAIKYVNDRFPNFGITPHKRRCADTKLVDMVLEIWVFGKNVSSFFEVYIDINAEICNEMVRTRGGIAGDAI